MAIMYNKDSNASIQDLENRQMTSYVDLAVCGILANYQVNTSTHHQKVANILLY